MGAARLAGDHVAPTEVDRKEARIEMRVDPMMQLNEAITSAVEAVAYPATVLLVVALLAVAAVELRTRMRRAEHESTSGDRFATHDRDRGGRVAPATR
jgi:hypothetical protein